MKSKKCIIVFLSLLLCLAFVMPVFGAENEEGQRILDKYTAEDQLGQPFLTTIRPFTGSVEEEAVPEDVQNAVSKYKALTVKAYNIDGIHIYDVYKNDGKKKPLLIYLHPAHNSRKFFLVEQAAAEQKNSGRVSFNDYANAGIRVITLDSPSCGSSDVGPLDFMTIIAETVRYIDHIIEYYNTVEDADATRFALQGYSQGADSAFSYVAHGAYQPAAIISDCGITDFSKVSAVFDCSFHDKWGLPNIMSKQQILTFARLYSPCNFPEKFENVFILSGCGEKDIIHPPAIIKSFEAKLKELGYKNFKFIYDKDTGHWPLEATRQNALPVLKKTLLKK